MDTGRLVEALLDRIGRSDWQTARMLLADRNLVPLYMRPFNNNDNKQNKPIHCVNKNTIHMDRMGLRHVRSVWHARIVARPSAGEEQQTP